jgi:O-glycosyl hydrolase
VLAAFRVYRNYDGSGAHFGDTSVHASSSDVERVTVYGSLDRADPDAGVVVAINKSQASVTVGLQLAHAASFASADVYRLTDASATLGKAETATTVAQNAFHLELPAQSISVIVPKL